MSAPMSAVKELSGLVLLSMSFVGRGPKRRKRMSAPMSAMGVLSGLVLLTMSFVDLDPKRNCKLRHGSDRRLGPDSFLHIRYAALWRGWSLAQLGWLQCEHGVKIGCTHCW